MKCRLSPAIIMLVAILLSGYQSSAEASDWVHFDTLRNGVQVYLDQEIVNKEGFYVRIWEKFVEPNGEVMKSYMEINCEGRQIRSLSSITYEKNGRVKSIDHNPMEWKHIPPDTHSENLYKRLCK